MLIFRKKGSVIAYYGWIGQVYVFYIPREKVVISSKDPLPSAPATCVCNRVKK